MESGIIKLCMLRRLKCRKWLILFWYESEPVINLLEKFIENW